MNLEPQITEYTITPFPQDHHNGHHWVVRIQRRPDTTWVVQHHGYWLQPDGTWFPDITTALHYGDERDATTAAQAALRVLDVNGVTFDDMCDRWGLT